MVAIRKNLVSDSVAKSVSYGKGNKKKYITIHETDNASKGANANSHGKLQVNGNPRKASWHYTVDDNEVVQSFDHTWMCWAAGSTKGNKESIHVEICVNSDGDYKKAVQNTVELVKKIMKDENIPINNVVQHNYWSSKNCPSIMRSGKSITWTQFKNMLSTKNEKEVVEMYEPSNESIKNSTEIVLQRLENKPNGISATHRKKLVEGKLTQSDAIGLIYVAIERGLIQGTK